MPVYKGCPIFLTFLACKHAIITKQETTKYTPETNINSILIKPCTMSPQHGGVELLQYQNRYKPLKSDVTKREARKYLLK